MSSSSAGSLLLGIGGAFVGSLVGMPALGFSIGASLGGALFPGQLPTVEGPRLEDRRVMASTYGVPITRVFGTNRVAGNLIWSSGIIEKRNETTVGGKGQPEQTQISYTYYASFAVAFCEGPVNGVGRIWADGKLLTSFRSDLYEDQFGTGSDSFFVNFVASVVSQVAGLAGYAYTIYKGDETQTPDPTIEAYEGTNNAPAYRGLCYIVFDNMPLAKFGNRIPSIEAEVLVDGTVSLGLTKVRNSDADGWNNEITYAERYGSTTGRLKDGVPTMHWMGDTIWVHRMTNPVPPYNDDYIDVYDMGMNYLYTRQKGPSDIQFNTGDTPIHTSAGVRYLYSSMAYCQERDFWFRVYAADPGGDPSNKPLPTAYPPVLDDNVYPYLFFGTGDIGSSNWSYLNILFFFTGLEAGNYCHGWAQDPSKRYMMLFFGDNQLSGGGGGSTAGPTERWYLIEIKYFDIDIIDSGTLPNDGERVAAGAWINHANIVGSGNTVTVSGASFGDEARVVGARADHLYKITYTIDSISGGSVRVLIGSNTMLQQNSPGTYTQTHRPTEANVVGYDDDYFGIGVTGGPVTAYISSLTIEHVPQIFAWGHPVIYHAAALENDMRHVWHVSNNNTTLWKIDALTKQMTQEDRGTTNADSVTTNDPFYQIGFVAVNGLLFWVKGDGVGVLSRGGISSDGAADLAAIITSVCAEVGISASDIDVTDLVGVNVKGFKIDRDMTARSIIEALQRAYIFDVSETDFQLKFILRSGTSTDAITADDLVSEVKTMRNEDTDLPLSVNVRYIDSKSDYQVGAQLVKRVE